MKPFFKEKEKFVEIKFVILRTNEQIDKSFQMMETFR